MCCLLCKGRILYLCVSKKRVAIIGGGAAGFFAAISAKQHYPQHHVMILEKSQKLLAKVKVSGGGRCNVTHACFKPSELIKHYPRGEKQLKKVFHDFHTIHTVEWFESRGAKLKTEADGRMFPVTDSSQTIIDCLTHTARKLGVEVVLGAVVTAIDRSGEGFELMVKGKAQYFDRVIVASGGSPKMQGFDWLKRLGHAIVPPVPSLFTFNMPNEPIRTLMGLSVSNATVRVQGTKLTQSGPLLITHWGMSGPAILKTSAWGARILQEKNYHFTCQVNWLGGVGEERLRQDLAGVNRESGKRMLRNKNPFQLPQRLWEFLLQKVELPLDKVWGELGKKGVNRLVNVLTNDQYQVSGKTTFKEEFVTCGGVDLSEIDFKTMQSKVCPGLYFAGEVLDIDGVTGGFNFQAAWTTGFIAGKSLT